LAQSNAASAILNLMGAVARISGERQLAATMNTAPGTR
jgi:hypothetical protein